MPASPDKDTPHIEPAAIEAFVAIVFDGLDGFVPVRLLSEKGSEKRSPQSFFPRVENAAQELVRLAPKAANGSFALCAVPATVAQKGRARSSDVAQTAVVLIDIDDGEPAEVLDHLTAHIGAPSLVVTSGGTTDQGHPKLHAYWRLKSVASGNDLNLVADARRLLAEKTGADTSFASLHQPIRVPGSVHGKNGLKQPVRILSNTSNEYNLKAMAESLDRMPALGQMTEGLAAQRSPGNGDADVRHLMTAKIREGGLDGVTRHDAMTKVIGHWIRNARTGNCTLEQARSAVHDHNQACISPPWPGARIDQEFNRLLDRDIENNGPMPRRALSAAGHGAPEFSDDALAAEFVAVDGENWKCVRSLGQWFHWDGRRWAPDETNLIRESIRRTCRTVSLTAKRKTTAQRIASARTISAVERIIASDPMVTALVGDFDSHPMLLNTPAGVVDLRTRETLAHDPSLLLSQITRGSFNGSAPRFNAFLREITNGDEAMIAYLQRLFGYAVTGQQIEQIFAFFHGSGANGKSKLLEAVSYALGDYAGTAAADTFMAASADRHTADLADLRGKRLVTVSELESGTRWAESRLKAITGGDPIKVRRLYKDHFEDRPQYKIIFSGNHRPSLSRVGAAMRRRLHLVPFEVTISAKKQDRALSERLRGEADGILTWLLEGTREWQRVGLTTPDKVTRSTEEYFQDEDILDQWLEDCCKTGTGFAAKSVDLFKSWSAWANERGHEFGSSKSFGERLREAGFQSTKVSGARGWKGVAIRRGPRTGAAMS
ncbi:hypothetical protein G3256_07950 [Roseobacter ponti]|uniref:SF3 helicase domain-containing protein n=1 Tax=Roseobacter ponti TaxID=1891787 RepID=A0A858SW56_9RHOB|nr:phage/plasmid primase, P4 family [Roseobacter ponti]QJF51096.1 hypothetical protein G3256_07950 [Roseobacter ponti]